MRKQREIWFPYCLTFPRSMSDNTGGGRDVPGEGNQEAAREIYRSDIGWSGDSTANISHDAVCRTSVISRLHRL